MFRYFLKNLWKTEVLAFITALATLSSLVIDSIVATKFEIVRLVPICFISIYIVYHVWRTWKFSIQTFSSIPLPYFLCLAQNHEWYISATKLQEAQLKKEGVAWDEIKNSFKIHRQDWAFFDSSKLRDNKDEWIQKTKEISAHFSHLSNRVETQPYFHIFIACPAPIAMGFGALFAGRVPFSMHQHVGLIKNPYKIIHSGDEILSVEEGYHILNKQVSNFKYIEIKVDELLDEKYIKGNVALVVLDFTGHRLPKPYPVEAPSNTIRLGIINEEGHIPLDSNWMLIAQEISSVITQELGKGKEISLLLGVPSSMAFLIGAILRTSSRVDIFYFNRSLDKYHKVFNLRELD